MESIWISLIVVAAIIVAIAVTIGIRRRRSNDYSPTLGPDDQPGHSHDARTTAASRFSDRTGSGAGGGV